MASPIDTMIKSINQAINLSIQLANTILSVFVVAADDDDGKRLFVFFGNTLLLLSNANTMIPAIKNNNPSND